MDAYLRVIGNIPWNLNECRGLPPGVVSVRQNDLNGSAARAPGAADVAKVTRRAVDGRGLVSPAEALLKFADSAFSAPKSPSTLGGEGSEHRGNNTPMCVTSSGKPLLVDRADLRHAPDQDGVHHASLPRGQCRARRRILSRIAAEAAAHGPSSTTEGPGPGGNVPFPARPAPVEHERRRSHPGAQGGRLHFLCPWRRTASSPPRARAADARGLRTKCCWFLLKPDYTLERLQVLGYLGMRGTHSEGFTLAGQRAAAAEQILPETL